MKKQHYNLELTEAEVRSIGSNRWLRKHMWQSICGFIGCMALMFAILVLCPDWEENQVLSVVGGILAFSVFVVPYLWWQRRMTKVGKGYLKEVTK